MARKNILCFGDSNTWGYTPGTGERFAPDVRWTGVAQQELGEEYHIIEDGQNGRTSGYDMPWAFWRNARDVFASTLIAQSPLDLLVIMLGTNDLQFVDAFTSAVSVGGLVKQAHMVNAYPGESPVFTDGVKILLISPILLHPNYNNVGPSTVPDAHNRSLGFAAAFKQIAENQGTEYLNAADYAYPSAIDNLHLEAEGHHALGVAVAKKIKEILG